MKVAYALLANAAEFTPDGKLYLLGGDIDTINASTLPVIYPFMVIVLKFRFSASESLQPRTLRLVPLGPDGQVMRPPMDMPLLPPRASSPESGLGICINLVNADFPVLGEYVFRIEVDGLEVAQLPLRVRLVQPEQ